MLLVVSSILITLCVPTFGLDEKSHAEQDHFFQDWQNASLGAAIAIGVTGAIVFMSEHDNWNHPEEITYGAFYIIPIPAAIGAVAFLHFARPIGLRANTLGSIAGSAAGLMLAYIVHINMSFRYSLYEDDQWILASSSLAVTVSILAGLGAALGINLIL
jgi:hypothetical protein